MRTSTCCCFWGILALTPLLHANAVTYTFRGVANGSVGTQTFLDATVTVTAKSDTSNVEAGFAQFNEIDFIPGTATLAISGFGSGTFDDLVYIVDNYGSDVLLLGGLFPSGNADIIELTDADLGSPVFSNYFLTTSLGPIGPSPDEAVASWQNIPTTLGDVSLTTYGAISFQATVGPEPSGQYLVVTGLFATGIAALLMRWRRRRHAEGRAPILTPNSAANTAA